MVNAEFWKRKKVLITGHTGFKGSWLCLVLQHFGAEIYGYALDPPTDPSLYALCKIDEFVNSTIADIRDLKSFVAKIEECKPEIIIHMAAQPLVRLSYSDPVLTYETNVMGTVNLFEAVRLSKSRSVRVILNVTTDKCYENLEWIWPYRENDALGGYDPYSNSKACSELVTSAFRNSFFNPGKYSEHGIAIATARAGNVIGGGDWATDRLIPDIMRAIFKNETIIIRNPNAIRPWQHVLEPLSGYLMLCEKLFSDGPRFSSSWNFGPEDNDTRTVEWIVKRICEMIPGSSYDVSGLSQPHEATFLKLDISKAKTFLKWKPCLNLEKALEMIVGFFIAYRERSDLNKSCEKQIVGYLTGFGANERP